GAVQRGRNRIFLAQHPVGLRAAPASGALPPPLGPTFAREADCPQSRPYETGLACGRPCFFEGGQRSATWLRGLGPTELWTPIPARDFRQSRARRHRKPVEFVPPEPSW